MSDRTYAERFRGAKRMNASYLVWIKSDNIYKRAEWRWEITLSSGGCFVYVKPNYDYPEYTHAIRGLRRWAKNIGIKKLSPDSRFDTGNPVLYI